LNLYTEYKNDPEMNEKCILHNYYTGPKVNDVGEYQLFRNEDLEEYREAQVKHFLQQSKVDVMFFTSPNEYGNMYKKEWFSDVFTVGILYDLIPLLFPEQCLFDKKYTKDYEDSIEFIKSLDLLLAISESAKNDAIKLLGIPEDKIKVIYAGIDDEFRKLPKINIQKLKAKYSITDPFILFAGGIDFKKNIEGLIRAYSKIGKSAINRYQLVIVGNLAQDLVNKFLEIAKNEGAENRVLCIGYVPKQDLIELYNIAEMLVFPSLYEGFGLPVIEAMACGTRVITSNCSSLKEIAEGHATLVNPQSIKSISKGLLEVINHPIESLKLAEESIEYALGFTWEKVAHLTISFIYNCFKEKENNTDYKFTIEDNLLRKIACQYTEKGENFTNEMMAIIAKEMLHIQNKSALPTISGKVRILYDVTVVREWLKANYSTGIGRVCVELFKELSNIANVIPINIEGSKDKIKIQPVSMKDYNILEDDVIISEHDIYFMPELHLRGIQVAKNHPKSQYFRDKGIKTYAVLYDLLPLQFPQYFETKTANSFHDYLVELIDNYDGILTDSKAVSDDLIKYYNEKINVKLQHSVSIGYFHLGKNSFSKINEECASATLKRFFEEDYVFYMIGTIEPRKGHEIVLRAFEKMWNQGKQYRLCIIGHMGWNMEKFVGKLKSHSENGNRLIFIEAASDTEVAYAYKNSAALIQASAGEGFGLPLIEAGQYNLPILCSDIPVFHEVVGDKALFFNRDSEESIINIIDEFLEKLEEGTVPSSEKIKGEKWCGAAKKVYNMIVEGRDWYDQIN
jgi:glycosyltransferase involved in cell wall biosynthesis